MSELKYELLGMLMVLVKVAIIGIPALVILNNVWPDCPGSVRLSISFLIGALVPAIWRD